MRCPAEGGRFARLPGFASASGTTVDVALVPKVEREVVLTFDKRLLEKKKVCTYLMGKYIMRMEENLGK